MEALHAKGVYILALQAPKPITVRIAGRIITLARGGYIYIGSAWGPGGLAARLRRHLCRRLARQHWHIDRILAHAEPLAAIACPGTPREAEHTLALLLHATRLTQPTERPIGASDDPNRATHLARAERPVEVANALATALPCTPTTITPGTLCGKRKYTLKT